MRDLKRSVYEPVKGKRVNEDDKRYVDNVYSSIDSGVRNLLMLIRGRDKNFEEADRLMEANLENAASSARLVANLQSAVPRFLVTGGGAGGTIVLRWILQIQIPDEVMYSGAVVAAALIYGLWQWKMAPRMVQNAQNERVKNAYRRGQYYEHFIVRCRYALSTLLTDILDIYYRIYREEYDSKYQDLAAREEVAKRIMAETGATHLTCSKLDDCFSKGRITADKWSTCQSNIGTQLCVHHKDP